MKITPLIAALLLGALPGTLCVAFSDFSDKLNFGVTVGDPFPRSDEEVADWVKAWYGYVPLIIALVYLFISMAILKLRYLYPTIEDTCSLFEDVRAI